MAKPKCHICGYSFPKVDGPAHPQARTKDHVVPKCRGGKDKRPAHSFCNNMKGALDLTDDLAARIRRAYERFHLGTFPRLTDYEGLPCRVDPKTGRLIMFDPKTKRDIGKVPGLGVVKAPTQ